MAAPAVSAVPLMKCVTVAIFEDNGKTILQPLVTKQEADAVQELFQNKTLELWLPNGQTDADQFDVGILKYKQVLQPLTKCSRVKDQICIKNQSSAIVSCEQCPLNNIEAGN
jgi:hypothetical protein